MTRVTVLAILLSMTALTVAAPVPPENKVLAAYGAWLDPDKDCKWEARDGKLRIAIPDKPHSMNPNPGKWNAPRVWRDVEGDFVAEVRVSFPIPGGGGPYVETNRRAVHAAGLIAWSSDDDHLRVAREAHTSDERPEEQFTWYPPRLGGKGEKMHTSIPSTGATETTAYIQIERRGDKVTSGYSRDRDEWYAFPALTVAWPAKVKVGVIAENGYPAPFEATFDEYKLTVRKK
jgi:hypothetical protein